MTAPTPVRRELPTDPWAHAAPGHPDPGRLMPIGRDLPGGRWVQACCAHRDAAVAAAGGPTVLDISDAHTVTGAAVTTEWSTRDGVPVVTDRVGATCAHAVWEPDAQA